MNRFTNLKGFVGAVLVPVGGFLLATWARESQGFKEPKPICGCTHHYAMHDDNGCHHTQIDMKLHAREERPILSPRKPEEGQKREIVKTTIEQREPITVTCGCKRYTGPEPLPRYIS